MPSQSGEANANSHWELESLSLRHSLEPTARNEPDLGPIAGEMLDVMEITNTPADAQAQSQHASDQEDVYHWLRWIVTDQSSPSWTRLATIRHSNLVQLTFQELNLPEEAQSLRSCLEMCFPSGDVKDVANRLLTTLLHDSICVTASSHTVLRRNTLLNGTLPRTRTFVYLRTQLRPEDWQIERYMLCLNCTEMSIQVLGRLAQQVLGDLEAPDAWDSHDCECLFREMDRFKLLSGKEAANSAMLPLSRRQMCLKLCRDATGQEHFRAVKFCPNSDGRLSLADLKALREAIVGREELQEYISEHRAPFRVPSQATCPDMRSSLQMSEHVAESQGMLIRKPPSWPRATPEFCFLVTDEHVDFDDVATLGTIMKKVQDRDGILGNPRGQIEEGDMPFVDRWIRVLQGEVLDANAF